MLEYFWKFLKYSLHLFFEFFSFSLTLFWAVQFNSLGIHRELKKSISFFVSKFHMFVYLFFYLHLGSIKSIYDHLQSLKMCLKIHTNNIELIKKDFKMAMSDFTKIKVIGRGSFGEAWLVKNKRDQKEYVIKQIQIFQVNKLLKHN